MSYGIKALKIRWSDIVRWPISETTFRVNDKGNTDTPWVFQGESIVKVDNRIDITGTDTPGTWTDLTSLITSAVTTDSFTQTPLTFGVVIEEAMSDREHLRKGERLHHGYPPGG